MSGKATTIYFEDSLPPGEYEIWIEGTLRKDPDAEPGFWRALMQPPDAAFSSGKHKISVGEDASPLKPHTAQGP